MILPPDEEITQELKSEEIQDDSNDNNKDENQKWFYILKTHVICPLALRMNNSIIINNNLYYYKS